MHSVHRFIFDSCFFFLSFLSGGVKISYLFFFSESPIKYFYFVKRHPSTWTPLCFTCHYFMLPHKLTMKFWSCYMYLYFTINIFTFFTYQRYITFFVLVGRGWYITFCTCKCKTVVWNEEETGKQTREDDHSSRESIQSSWEEDTSSTCSGTFDNITVDLYSWLLKRYV